MKFIKSMFLIALGMSSFITMPLSAADTPATVLAAVTDNGNTCLKTLLKVPNAETLFVTVAPDREKYGYFSKTHGGDWEWGVVDLSDLTKNIKYSGKTTNGFCISGFVWSPKSDELALGLNYASALDLKRRVSATKYDVELAKICERMASAGTDEVSEKVGKIDRSGLPVWGVNGQYYESEYLAQKDGVTAFQAGEARLSYLSSLPIFIDGTEFAILTDNNAKMAHVFKENKFIESFRIATLPLQGWWLLNDTNGKIWAKKQMVVSPDPTDPPKGTGRAAGNFKWVGVDLGKGSIEFGFAMQRGIIVQISRGDSQEIVFLETRLAEKVAQLQK